MSIKPQLIVYRVGQYYDKFNLRRVHAANLHKVNVKDLKMRLRKRKGMLSKYTTKLEFANDNMMKTNLKVLMYMFKHRMFSSLNFKFETLMLWESTYIKLNKRVLLLASRIKEVNFERNSNAHSLFVIMKDLTMFKLLKKMSIHLSNQFIMENKSNLKDFVTKENIRVFTQLQELIIYVDFSYDIYEENGYARKNSNILLDILEALRQIFTVAKRSKFYLDIYFSTSIGKEITLLLSSAMSDFPALVNLELRANVPVDFADFIKAMNSNKNLKALSLWQGGYNYKPGRTLATLPESLINLRSLESLEVTLVEQFDDLDGVNFLKRLSSMANLINLSLNLTWMQNGYEEMINAITHSLLGLKYLKNLKLHMRNLKVNKEMIEPTERFLSYLANLKNLNRLSVFLPNFVDKNIDHIYNTSV